MDTRVENAVKGFSDRWNLLSFNQKIMLGTMVVALVLSSFFLFQQANNDYDVLYTNMSLPDAAATVAKLKEMREPFKLADGGTTILVPRDRKNNLVLETANELSGESTVNLGKIPPVVQGEVQKEWIKKLNTQAISEILRGIRGIKNAQVIISQPEHSVFSDNQDPVKASVMLSVEPGFRMREEQVKTIKSLVAHSVPGLLMENVAISDNSGNPLEGPGGVIMSGNTEADLRQKNFEEKIKKKVLAILSPVVGKENAVVSVSAMLNFDHAEAEIHRVIPSGGSAELPTGLAVSNQTQTEEYTGGKKPAEGGAPGLETNIPTYQGLTDEEGKEQNYKLTKSTTNYVNSEERKKVIYAPGTIERLTVAVVLNKVLTAKETQEIRELVENAAGVDPARGDAVDIKGFQFSAPPADKEAELAEASKAAQDQAFYLQLASVGAVVLLGLAGLFIFYSLFRKPAEGELVEEIEDYSYVEQPQQLLEEMPIPVIEAKLDPEIEHMRESINNMVAEDPGEAARVLVTYMKEI